MIRGHRLRNFVLLVAVVALSAGCTTMKESYTARTGIEQLLISSATDRALEKIDLRPIAGAKVFVDLKYLDCVDKNYLVLALHQRLLATGCTLVDKAEDSQVIVAVASGGMGTDGTELFVGTPEIPLPPPSPISIPKLSVLRRNRAIGTAKLALVAYDTASRQPMINEGYTLARADHKTWNLLGFGGISSGSVYDELQTHTGDKESLSELPAAIASQNSYFRR